MNKNGIIILALAACGLGLAAVFMGRGPATASSAASSRTSQASSASTGNALLLPSLAGKASDITGVRIERDGKVVELARTQTGWVLPLRGNYQAKTEPVAKLVRGLLESSVLENKTSDPTLFERLSVQDVPATGETPKPESSPGSGSVTPALVSLLAKDGTPLAQVVLGKAQQSASGDSTKAATFAREKGKNQALLISGTFTTPVDHAEWFERGILEIDRTRFARASVQLASPSPDGAPAPLVIERKSQTEESYQVVGLPAERELKDTTGPQRVATVLASVTVDDVAPAASKDFAAANTATFSTFDGVVFRVRMIENEGKPWINIAVAFDAALDTTAPAAPAAEQDPVASSAAQANHKKALEERTARLTKEASDLHARLSPWAFAAPAFMAEQLRATMESLLKPAAASTPSEGAPPPVLVPGG